MIKNYLKIAWRNILSNKVYSALNILGLAAGMAVALVIGLWVQYQYSFDKSLPGYSQLYQVRRNFNSNGTTLTFSSTSLKLADALRNNIPEIEGVAESDWMWAHGLRVDNRKFYLPGAQVGGDFLKMFRYPFIEGNAQTALKEPYSIVLTESTAKALFGNENSLGKTVRIDNQHDVKVTGVIKDLPANSSFWFKYVLPFSYFEQTQSWVKAARTGNFAYNGFQIFVKLKPGISYAQVEPKIRDIEKTEPENTNARNSKVILQPVQDWHLYNEYKNGIANSGFIDYVHIFSVIGLLVLVIACINFINLSTARSEKRAREVGVRKAIGSLRSDLIFQFLIESALVTFISFLCCLAMVTMVLPSFNSLAGTSIAIPYSSFTFWLILIACVSLTALMAGGKPAFYLSSFNPVQVLKGTISSGKSKSFSRQVLVVVQFTCSIALIISTVIIYQQIRFAKDRPTGYSIDRLVATDLNDDLDHNYVALKNELLQSGLVQSATTATSPATDVTSHSDIDHWPGKLPGETVEMGNIGVSDDYFKTLGMKIIAGRDFLPGAKTDSNNVVLNEAAVKRLRLKDPINQILMNGKQPMRIIGVVKDALMISPFAPADPTLFFPGKGGNMIYKLSPNVPTHEAVEKITAIFNKYNPGFPFDYRFVDDVYNKKFQLEMLIGKLSGIFAGLAIFISCLGLFGLAAFVAEQRAKEIGIRKVLGATIAQVWLLLSKDFILLVIISCIIASPLAYYFLQHWLMKYDYRISIGPGVFLISALLAIIITLVTISFQAIKAALMNPVKSLKSE